MDAGLNVVGPWTGECGDEFLSWIPLCKRTFGDNFVAISRGGTDHWYPGKVINAYDVVPPTEFKELLLARKAKTATIKSFKIDAFDKIILERLGLKTNFHPCNLFNLGRRDYRKPNKYIKLPKPEPWPGLPKDYIAARFYKNDWLRKRAVPKVDGTVVSLVLTEQPDNHEEFAPLDGSIVIEYGAHNSFEVLNRVIGNAQKFIGSYGSIAFLPLMFGVPSEGYCNKPGSLWEQGREATLARENGTTLKRFCYDRSGWTLIDSFPLPDKKRPQRGLTPSEV